MTRAALFALALAACTPFTAPYVRTYPVALFDDGRDLMNDGPPMVIEVTNPTAREVRTHVQCAADGYAPAVDVVVPPHATWRALGQVLARYAHGEPCWLTSTR